jgi:predicted metalloprotease
MLWDNGRRSENVEDRRVQWCRRGLESGELSACDAFKAGRV